MTEHRWIDLGDGRKVFRREQSEVVKRSHLPAPTVIGDSMPETQSMLDGKVYTSKSSLRQSYREAGVVEVGNDPARLQARRRPKVDRNKVKESVQRAAARFERGERVSSR